MFDKNHIHNDEATKKKTTFLHLSDIIGNDPNWLFPLNKERLDELLDMEYPKDEVNDFRSVFWYIIQKMKESGVPFFSPGGSYDRRFAGWFNSHFWEGNLKVNAFEKEEHLFKESYQLVKKYSKISLNLKAELIEDPKSNELIILGGNVLSSLGKEFLFSLYPISLLAFKKFG